MKRKITFLSIALALLGLSQTSFAQPIYQQSFDVPQFPPPGWTVSNVGSASNFYTACVGDTAWQWVHSGQQICSSFSSPAQTAHSGAGMAGYNNIDLFTSGTYVNVSRLTTQALNFSTPGAAYKVEFWMFNYNTFGNYDQLNVYVTTSQTGPFTSPILTITPTSNSGFLGWQRYEASIPTTFNGTTNYITFETQGNEDNDYLLDDVSINQYLPCTGTPASVISGPASVCAGIPFTLVDNATQYALNLTYQWQSRIAGTPTFVDVPGGNTNTINQTIGIPMEFRLITKCNSTGLSDTTAPYSVGINPFYNCYCGPNTAVNLGGSIFPLIDSVSLTPGTLANATPGILPGYYAQYPASGHTTTNLQAGATYTVKAMLSNFGASAQAWIDFDQNGTFDASEWVDMATPGTSNIASGTFTVPQNATPGLTGLRIRSGGSNSAGSACASHDGETEDYIVNMVPAPPNDMAAMLILQPLDNSSICANTNFMVKAVIKNLGTAAQSNVIVKATYGDGSASNTIYVNDQNTIGSFETDTVSLGMMSIPSAGTYTLKVYTALTNDLNTMDDTAYSTLRVKALPDQPIPTSDTVCLGDTARISVHGESSSIYNWYNSPSGGSVVYTGSSMTINSLMNTTVYYVSSITPGIVNHLPSTPLTNGSQGCVGGITFDLQPQTNLTVDSFKAKFNATGLQQVDVYYRDGSAAGNETNPNAWIWVGSTAVNVTSTATVYPINVHVPLQLTSGSTYGIYLNYNASYTPAPGTSVYNDANLTIDMTNGLGLCGTFSSPQAGNMYFNGSVYYHVGGSDCESNRVPVIAAVGPRPVIDLGADRTVCQSPSFMLDAGNPGGRYQWGTLNGSTWNLSANDTNQRLHVDTSATYVVIVNKYCVDSDTVAITMSPLPYATGINYTRSGNTYNFHVSGAQNVTGYLWKFGDNSTSTDPAPVHTYPTGGQYNILLVVYNDCGTDTVHWSIPTAVNNVPKDDHLVLYPNPATSKLTISGTDNMEISEVTIINMVGAVVYKGDIGKAKSGTIDISNLASGHYILRAVTSGGTYNQAFDVLRQ